MRKVILPFILLVFCGLFLLYAFQQKTVADKNAEEALAQRNIAIELQQQLQECQSALDKELSMKKEMLDQATREKEQLLREHQKK